MISHRFSTVRMADRIRQRPEALEQGVLGRERRRVHAVLGDPFDATAELAFAPRTADRATLETPADQCGDAPRTRRPSCSSSEPASSSSKRRGLDSPSPAPPIPTCDSVRRTVTGLRDLAAPPHAHDVNRSPRPPCTWPARANRRHEPGRRRPAVYVEAAGLFLRRRRTRACRVPANRGRLTACKRSPSQGTRANEARVPTKPGSQRSPGANEARVPTKPASQRSRRVSAVQVELRLFRAARRRRRA